MRAWQGAQGYCEAAVAQVQHCREALFLILRWGPGSKWSSFLSFVRLMGLGGNQAGRGAPGGVCGGPYRPIWHQSTTDTTFKAQFRCSNDFS